MVGVFSFRFMSKSEGSFRFFGIDVVVVATAAAVAVTVTVLMLVGILRVPLTDIAMAGMVPVPVAAIMEGSACCKSHWIVSPSDLWPSSLVSWNIRVAQVAGIRILLPLPSTFVCRSLVDDLLGGGGGGVVNTFSSNKGSFFNGIKESPCEEAAVWGGLGGDGG